ncbi:hypothetical protein GCM10023200_46790 [Actinomycetospora chlora]|uniref:Serine hydrolase n=1 Tax=Actinomycetospora chlora TaxID=663608 RepID=A0ABP9C2R4_9PSEU
MTTLWRPLVALLLLAVAAGCSAPARPQSPPQPRRRDGSEHVVSGTVVAEQAGRWTVRAGATTYTVTLTPQTAFGTSRQPQPVTAFPVGAQVRVHGTVTGPGAITARRVSPPLRGTRPPGTPAPPTTAVPTPSPTPGPAPTAVPAADVPAAVSAADAVAGRHPGTMLGVAVADGTDGPVTLGTDGARPFESASVVKLYTVVDVLHRAETGATLTPADTDDVQAALTRSDDGAMDDLWERWGDVATVEDVVSLAHLQDTQPPSDTGEWGETTTSARDVLAVYRYALTALDAPDRATVTGALGDAAPSGADGFDQSFGLLETPRPAGVEAKQGWMQDGPLFLHTTGRPAATSPYLVAVLSEQPADDSWDTARATLDDATHALVGGLAAPAA